MKIVQRAGHTTFGGSASSETVTSDASLAALIDEHATAVYRLARSIVRDAALSEDVAQETFIKAWRHLDDFRGEGSRRGWLLTIAHREAINVLRRSRDTAVDPQHLRETPARGSVSATVEGKVAFEGFQLAIESLDELSRSILVLREIEGFAYDEIAKILDVPVPTVKTRLLRARRRVASELGGWR